MATLARVGVGPFSLLITIGRRTGRERATPVVPVSHDGRRWLVAPYGPVAWVKNARAAGSVELRRGRTREAFEIREVDADEAAPVLKRYVAVASATRPYFDAAPDAPVAEFRAEADRHPVFELTPLVPPPTP